MQSVPRRALNGISQLDGEYLSRKLLHFSSYDVLDFLRLKIVCITFENGCLWIILTAIRNRHGANHLLGVEYLLPFLNVVSVYFRSMVNFSCLLGWVRYHTQPAFFKKPVHVSTGSRILENIHKHPSARHDIRRVYCERDVLAIKANRSVRAMRRYL